MTAILSPCGTYRYRLARRWAPGPVCLFVMLNPSTADAERDDATIRRCIAFARRDGFGSIEVVNLFAFRATDPRELRGAVDPIGPDNDRHIAEALAERPGLIVAAWGSHAGHPAFIGRARDVFAMLGPAVHCLGLTSADLPKHPVRLPASTPFQHLRAHP